METPFQTWGPLCLCGHSLLSIYPSTQDAPPMCLRVLCTWAEGGRGLHGGVGLPGGGLEALRCPHVPAVR